MSSCTVAVTLMSLIMFFSVILATVPNGNARQNGDTGNRFSTFSFNKHEFNLGQ